MRRLLYLLPVICFSSCLRLTADSNSAAGWFLPILILGLLSMVLTVYALYRLYHASYSQNYKIIWLVIILFGQTLGAIAYFIFADRLNEEPRA